MGLSILAKVCISNCFPISDCSSLLMHTKLKFTSKNILFHSTSIIYPNYNKEEVHICLLWFNNAKTTEPILMKLGTKCPIYLGVTQPCFCFNMFSISRWRPLK